MNKIEQIERTLSWIEQGHYQNVSFDLFTEQAIESLLLSLAVEKHGGLRLIRNALLAYVKTLSDLNPKHYDAINLKDALNKLIPTPKE